MEDLFDRLSFSDLLSASDLSDPASPISTPDLRLLMQRLESHSLQIKSKVQSYLLSHRQEFSSLISFCNDAASESDDISADVSDLIRLVSDRPVDVEIRKIFQEMRAKTKEGRVKRELLELVRTIVEISERLKGAREALRIGRIRFAAKELRALKQAVRYDEDETVEEPVVYGLLRKEWFESFEEIQEVLGRFVENAVQFEQESNIITVKYHLGVPGIHNVDLPEVLETMDEIGILDYGLSKVGNLVINSVITPVINCSSSISFVEENRDTGEMKEATLKMVLSGVKMEKVDCRAIFSGIIQVIKFVSKCICLQNVSWTRCFGRLTWPRVSELIISIFLSKVLPDDASKLAEFQNIIKLTSEFENALKEMTFISASDSNEERLSGFAENVEVHFAYRKKIEILAKARNLLLQCDFLAPHEYTYAMDSSDHIVDLLFMSESCVVSKAASRLMKLVHETLQDLCLSSTRVVMEFYRAARDALILYEAVIPVKLERQLSSVNQAAILMRNDSLYLSQEILGLAFEYRSGFPSPIKEHAVFMDMAPRFHIMAEETIRKQIRLVLNNLKEAMDGTEGFHNTHEIQHFESAKFGLEQVVYILEKVRVIWEPLLQPLTYKEGMCVVLETVFSRIAKEILHLDDIAPEETLQLQRLIHAMLENLYPLFESLISVNQNENVSEVATPPLDSFIPSLLKIRRLADLMDMQLQAIMMIWDSGELFNAGFKVSEMEGFIKAIFADSPLREECLWRIKNSVSTS